MKKDKFGWDRKFGETVFNKMLAKYQFMNNPFFRVEHRVEY